MSWIAGTIAWSSSGPSGSDGEVVAEEFVAAWGWGVSDGKARNIEVCTSACQAGIAGAGKGQLQEAGPIAVDNSPGVEGTVYVGADAAAKHPDVQRFAADGEKAAGQAARRGRRQARWSGGRSAGERVGLSR